MKYLIIDKRQRIELENTHSYTITRLIEEIEKLGGQAQVGYYDTIGMHFRTDGLEITASGTDVRDFTHILPRAHSLDRPVEYETKRIIVDYIDQHNRENPGKEIQVQNGDAIKSFPYYDKLYMSTICAQNNVPLIETYYRLGGGHPVKQNPIPYPYIAKDYTGKNDLRLTDGKEKVKKNVFKVDNAEGFNQEFLRDKDLRDYILQEFIPSGEDIRVFVKKGEPIAAFRRVATEGFMTVNKGDYTLFDLSNEPETRELAQKVATIFKADFMAVDLMYKDGSPLLQEISFNPGFKILEKKIEENDMNMAKEIVTAF